MIEAPRGAVQIQDATGDVRLQVINHDVVVDNLKGALTLEANAGNHRFTDRLPILRQHVVAGLEWIRNPH